MLMIGPPGCTAFTHSSDNGEIRIESSDGLFDIPMGLIIEAGRHGFRVLEIPRAPLTPANETEKEDVSPVPDTDASAAQSQAAPSPAESQPVKLNKRGKPSGRHP